MTTKFEYTTLAHRYTARFPMLTYVGTQVNFWIIANILLAAILNFHWLIISRTSGLPASRMGSIIFIAIMLGVFYGLSLGLADYYLDKNVFKKLPLGKVILLKALGSMALLFLLLWFLRLALLTSFISPSLYMGGMSWNEDSWKYLFYLLMTYYFFMTLLISFINQVNKKYGPGILLPLLLGRYRDPKEEQRIFMFMDLKSSTATAEVLGHLKYSAFIRDCFSDINEVLYPFRAQVYQYVGDEIVVTWPESEGLKNHFCLGFYFACQRKFRERSGHYLANYAILPQFKAGAHTGSVTTVEIGEVKRDIAYHGDTLNTASRIQSLCNEYSKNFIVSRVLLNKVGLPPTMITEELGSIQLKGKTAKVELISVGLMKATEA